MDFLINQEELAALCGLPHAQQLAYLRGIRPYMDIKTGLVGLKRGISYQSIAEQLYIEPHQGIKSASFSRAQVRRALSSLERAGLICIQSDQLKLILSCPLASKDYFVQNKPVTKPSQKAVLEPLSNLPENRGFLRGGNEKAVLPEGAKAVTPHSYIYNIFLFKQFEKFWELYPVKNSQSKAWEIFETLSPNDKLVEEILSALKQQIAFTQQQRAQGRWVPNWKNPANWLAQRCWLDASNPNPLEEIQHAKHYANSSSQPTTDPLWASCASELTNSETCGENVVPFRKHHNESR